MRLALAALSLLAACTPPAAKLTVADILADPARYEEQSVELAGEVTDAVGIFSLGMYTLSDGTGEINVTTSSGLPAAGTRLTVRGEVRSGVTLGGKHYGVTLSEAERTYDEAE